MLIAAHARSILLDYWDPKSIRNVPKARGEYDSYIGHILREIASGATAERLARFLLSVETDDFKQGGDRDRALFVAQKLLSGDQMTMETDPDQQ